MHHGHQRRANEAAAIEAAVLIARSAETGRTALSEEAEEDLAESDTELDTAASAAGVTPPQSDKRRGGGSSSSAAGGEAAAAEAERERLARQCDELATECSTLRLQVEDLEGKLDEEKAAWVEQVTLTARAEAKLATAVNARGGGGGDDDGGGGGGGTALSKKEASAALAVAAQHQCLDPDNPTSVLAAVERLGAALAETEDELVELTEQLTEALQAASINTSMVSKGTAREAELQAELDACHETIEQLAAQLEAPS
jgi:DNA repair exonuclease SbcCD ATPase subunit